VEIFRAIKALFSVFTIFHIDIDQDDFYSFSRNFWITPLIGVLFGGLASTSLLLFNILFTSYISATVTLILIHTINRFMHVDGLTDFGDGLLRIGSREERFKAMKDTRVGAGGVTLLLLITVLTISLYSSVSKELTFIPFITEILSRGSMVACAGYGLPYKNGLGSRIVKFTKLYDYVKAAVLMLILTLTIYPICLSKFTLLEYITSIMILIVISFLGGVIIGYLALNSVGYVTGDVLGAANELSRVVILLFSLKIFTWIS